MALKIVAYSIKGTRTGLKISAMVQSPRGTRVIKSTREVASKEMSKSARTSAIDAAIKELQSSVLGTG